MKKTFTVQLISPPCPSKGLKIEVLEGDCINNDKKDFLSSDLIQAFCVKADTKKEAIAWVIYYLGKQHDRPLINLD